MFYFNMYSYIPLYGSYDFYYMPQIQVPVVEQMKIQNQIEIINKNDENQKFSTNQENQKYKKRLNDIYEKLKIVHKEPCICKKTHWTQKQDELLAELVQKEKIEWKQMPNYLQGRTLNMCYSRYRRKMLAERSNWKKQDDQLIVQLVSKIGEKWKQISNKIKKFTPKQIRQRYLNYLREQMDKSQFTLEQDFKICQLVLTQGRHWRKFEQNLQGRSEGAIKSRFYSKLRKIMDNTQNQNNQF